MIKKIKHMKKIVALLIGIAACVMVCSCEPETTLMVSESVLNFERQGGKASVTMVANKVWEVSSSQSWCKVSPTLGDGTNDSNFTLSIICDKNDTFDARTCQITIKCAERATTISINQKENLGIGVPKRDFEVTYEAQTISIEVQSNVDYSVVTSQGWLKITKTKGLTPSTITVAVNENDGNSRVGKITIQALGQTVVDVSIKQQATPHIVVFEDDIFERYCLDRFDKNKDGIITYAEAKEVDEINLDNSYSSNKIKSLAGIEKFTNIVSLVCTSNLLSSLDLTSNTKLVALDCTGNQLSSLDLRECTSLVSLFCDGNQLTTLNVDGLTELYYLRCSYNQLTSLDLKGCSMNFLYCNDNQLTSLDLKECSISDLRCDNNQLTSLDLKGCTIYNLRCSNNQLTSLDLKGCSMNFLYCNDNQLTSLDLKECSISDLRCDNNQLTSLDLKGCTIYNNLYCSNNQLTGLDLSSTTINKTLDCCNNQLTSLDLSEHYITTVNCSDNQLTSLGLKECYITNLYCSNNQLTSLDVSYCYSLRELYCQNNPYLTEIWVGFSQRIRIIIYKDDTATIKEKPYGEADWNGRYGY